MNIDQVLAALTPEIVERFKTAIETGKWPDGRLLTPEQRETCMQAVVAWEHKHLPEEQRTGYIDRGSKKKDESCDSHSHDSSGDNPDEERPLRLV
ncbi:YeaC family protein [Alkanindiges illinoisensis]|uniref:YeaC family protein n=1 Tax=Alkanindiges illinoisensis TaxID=197183 RepID=UPI00047AC2FF|nr:YeaC family protein [Alkanindiges illinoisensis]